MKQYFSLYKQIIKINFAVFLAYRANLIGHFIVTFVWSVLAIFTMVLLTSKAKMVLGWTQSELLLMTGALTIVLGFFSFLFKKSFQHIPETILYGDLDGLLLKPVDNQFLVTLMHVHFSSSLRVIIGIVFVIYVIIKFQIQVTMLSSLSFIVLLFFGLTIFYSLWLIASSLLIWFPRLSNILDLANSLNHASRYPPEMYQELNMFLFLFLLPYTLILATPVRVLVQSASIFEVVMLLVYSAVLFIFSRKLWKFALRSYGSASG